ncbi:hypothetical protein N7532_001688 [Penicillium argentinense]|uniref:DNA replication checkpoint mediator MRC1 domain-containing protein n=1 Tax=Penicillium argentinense TaxID=1131581 RepID=A0A9W9G365_9EURO|nr:uncharacterized protein N7532_001688 [Penicillium argentinense]KAJ5111153.1 hypothetical protein N7532_001688 [Penicillium argentinense]
MSSASTPRSTRSASPTSDANSPNMLTPGQKIKAMMAEFDSDSDSDSQSPKKKSTIPKLDFGKKHSSNSKTRPPQSTSNNASDNDSDDADDIVRPRGRMAARMQNDSNDTSPQDSAFSRLSNALRAEREQAQKPSQKSPAPADESSDDELPTAGPKRKNNLQSKRPTTPGSHPAGSPVGSRADSPLFVSSPEASSAEPAILEEEGPAPDKNAKFLALVAQKRTEREVREKAEAEEKAARRAKMEQFSSDILSGEESEGGGPGSAQKLSQKARQPRKASKKALEEMSRETQRMSRNMQLAHQAQTKKKITKESLFARFNFMQTDAPPAEPAAVNSSSTAGSQNSSDAEGQKAETPRTSPVLGPSDAEKPAAAEATGQDQTEGDKPQEDVEMTDLPTLEEVIADTQFEPKDLKGSANAPVTDAPAKSPSGIANMNQETRKVTPPSVRVLMSRQEVAQHQHDGSDSDDLEVITSPAKCRRIAAFENLPARKVQETSSMTKFKALAHLTSPNRKMSSMSSSELSASLLYKARQQAAKDRRERIEELRAKGVVIETAEERAAMEDNVEDLVEKARKEADDIAREERAARRKAKGLDPDDEEDDDDYTFSGSEDGSGEDENEDEDDNNSTAGENGYFEQEADEGDESSGDDSEAAASDVELEAPGSRRKRRTRVVSDDEDDDDNNNEQQIPSTPVRPSAQSAQSAERPKFPGMETPNMSLGLTQAFAGTLADDDDATASQPGSGTIPFSLPDPGQPVPRLRAEDSEILVKDSQEQPEFMPAPSQNFNSVSESPASHGFSQFSQIPDPTQDEGFVFSPFDPAKRFRETPPVSTIDTVIVGQSQSPIAQRKAGKLRRGRANLSMVEEENEDEGDYEVSANAFNIMKKSAKKAKAHVPYDKKNSKAKGVVDEAAEESEDEYAGIGGASDDSDGEEDVRDLQMINDNSGEVVDEKELAALNASHQRNRDEKDVAKLLKDITTGALRRRRGPDDDFDLDDSDDEQQARRREKQREFAKMRRALLADDKVGELAENPKKAAFFKAIEDRDEQDDFELDFLEENEGGSQNESSQDIAAAPQTESAEDKDSRKRKRPLEPSAEDATNRPPPHLRRTAASAMSKKPATLAEIRETLSFLTETPEYDSFHEDASLDEDAGEDDEDDANSGNDQAYSDDNQTQSKESFAKPSHPRRTRGTVVDRLALLRQASSNSATATNSTSTSNPKMAFHNGGSSEGPIGFRPPQLLRRVTSGSSSSNSTTSSSSSKIPRAAASGSKKGGAVNSYTAAREQERERQLRVKQRNGGSNIAKLLNKHANIKLGALAGKGQWD